MPRTMIARFRGRTEELIKEVAKLSAVIGFSALYEPPSVVLLLLRKSARQDPAHQNTDTPNNVRYPFRRTRLWDT